MAITSVDSGEGGAVGVDGEEPPAGSTAVPGGPGAGEAVLFPITFVRFSQRAPSTDHVVVKSKPKYWNEGELDAPIPPWINSRWSSEA